jgi:hypothetical protein
MTDRLIVRRGMTDRLIVRRGFQNPRLKAKTQNSLD